MPRAARHGEKIRPNLGVHSYVTYHRSLENFLKTVSDEVHYVLSCNAFYWNEHLPEKTRFRQSAQGVEGIYSDGKVCAKFRVRTTVGEEGDLGVVVADLNQWLDNN